ncbi:Coiled-coil domain-containing protein 102A [Schistosoma japonicum]|nr:Coiled-coil domain-containing protein 102A [Schistosoma japonicum]
MRWWSDCTASWREKWASLRDERNYLRDKLNSTQKSLENATELIDTLKLEKQQLLDDFCGSNNQTNKYNSISTMKSTVSPVFSAKQETSQSGFTESNTNQSNEKLKKSLEIGDETTGFLKSNESTRTRLLELLSTNRWWKNQCMALEQENRHLFELNTKNWSKYKLVSHENVLLRQENDFLKKEIADSWCIRENQHVGHAHAISCTDKSEPQDSNENNECVTYKQNIENIEISVEDLLLQLSERNCQIDLLQRRLSFMLHERGVLCHQLEEMSIVQDNSENKTHVTAKNKRTRFIKNVGTLDDDCSKYSYRTELDSNCDTECISEVPKSMMTNILNDGLETISPSDESTFINNKINELQSDATDG